MKLCLHFPTNCKIPFIFIPFFEFYFARYARFSIRNETILVISNHYECFFLMMYVLSLWRFASMVFHHFLLLAFIVFFGILTAGFPYTKSTFHKVTKGKARFIYFQKLFLNLEFSKQQQVSVD